MLQGDLPQHMRVGRGNMPGPVNGGYVPFTMGPFSVPISQTNISVGGVILPADFRLQAIAYYSRTGVANADIQFYVHTSFPTDATDGTALASAVVALDTGASGVIRPSGTTPTLVAAQRSLSKGDYIYAGITTDGTGVITDLTFIFIGHFTGHVNTNPDND